MYVHVCHLFDSITNVSKTFMTIVYCLLVKLLCITGKHFFSLAFLWTHGLQLIIKTARTFLMVTLQFYLANCC